VDSLPDIIYLSSQENLFSRSPGKGKIKERRDVHVF